MNDVSGILLIDKPTGMTSHDVVDVIRRVFGLQRVGHAGTLDPNATGLLIILLGRATKLSRWLTGLDKTYVFTALLGIETTTGDRWGDVINRGDIKGIDEKVILEVSCRFHGRYQQIAPAISAIKHEGVPLYRITRDGGKPPEKTRLVRIRSLQVIDIAIPFVTLIMKCSSGTYVRSIVRDMGRQCGCYATVFCLRRTAIGKFTILDAIRLEELGQKAEQPERLLIPMSLAMDFLPSVVLNDSGVRKVRNGVAPSSDDLIDSMGFPVGTFCLNDSHGDLVAIAKCDGTDEKSLVNIERVI
ncbi:MAG: tRNA pseudouridine(55) synthase TruB [bacterium]